MKVSVDNSACEGHGQCYIVDPEFFTLDDDGYCNIGEGKEVPAGSEDLVQEGVDACPVAALTVDEE